MLFRLKISKYKIDIFLIFIILLISIPPRIWNINYYPPIIVDEAANIRDIKKVLNSNVLNPIDYEWGYGQSIIVHYPSTILVRIGFNELLAVRLISILLSLLSLIPFYFIAKKHTNKLIAFCSTLLFSYSYYFLQFSRVGWTNMYPITLGLYLLWILNHAIQTKSKLLFGISGFIAGLIIYTYRAGEIYIFASFLLILVYLLNTKNFKLLFKNILLFLSVFIITCLPWIYKILSNWELYTLRSKVVSINNAALPYHQISDKNDVIIYQILTSIKSWILLLPYYGGGAENLRYIPINHAPVNIVIALFFIIGLLIALYKWRVTYVYLFIFFSGLVFGQILTVDPPNGSRGLILLPIIYLFSAMGIYYIFRKFEKYKISKYILITITIIIALWDLYIYTNWMTWIKV